MKMLTFKGRKDKAVIFSADEIKWSTDAPYCIIMCLLDKEDDLIEACGNACRLFDISIADENQIAKLMFVNEITIKDIKYACDICREKEITQISYFFGILHNLIEYKNKSNSAEQTKQSHLTSQNKKVKRKAPV